jgi:hypothetical protein
MHCQLHKPQSYYYISMKQIFRTKNLDISSTNFSFFDTRCPRLLLPETSGRIISDD